MLGLVVSSPRGFASRRIMLWGGAFALAAVLFLLGLGIAPLIDRDEPAYAEAAREMLAHRDWGAPRFNGQPWFDKPPLVYWAEMISYRALGVNETAARLPVALFGLAGLAAVYWVGRRLQGPRAGAFAAGVLATSLLYLGLARVVLLDVPFTVCFTVAMGALIAGIQEPDRARWPLLAGAALGLAVLAKSPSACILFGAVLLAAGVVSQAPLRARGLRWGYAALVCAAVAAPWYGAMTLRYGSRALAEFLAAGNVGRFMHAEHVRSATPLYYIPIILLGFLPWTAMLPGSLRAAWRERGRAAIPLLWAFFTFAFFTAAQSKLPGYILPMFPALALLVGLDLDRIIRQPSAPGSSRGLYYAAASTLVVTAVFTVWAAGRTADYLWGTLFLACFAMLPLGLVIRARGSAGVAAVWTFAFGVAAAAVLGYGLLPAAARLYSARELARRIQADGQRHRIYLLNIDPLHVPSLLFYSRQTVIAVEQETAPSLEPEDVVIVEGNVAPKRRGTGPLRHVASAEGLTVWTPRPDSEHNDSGPNDSAGSRGSPRRD